MNAFQGPMRVVLCSGATLLVDSVDQATVIPQGVALEPTGTKDADGRLVYRELNPQAAAMAAVRRLDVSLNAAASALEQAAGWLAHGSVAPCPHCKHPLDRPGARANQARQTKEAANAARIAHLEIAGAVDARE